MNTIISGNSDPRVLVVTELNGGLINYFLYVSQSFSFFGVLALCGDIYISRSFGFSGECLGQHSGTPDAANLGDGNGYGRVLFFLPPQLCFYFISHIFLTGNETSEVRWDYGDSQLGACKETIQGGNHFRYWIQNGPQGDRYDTYILFSLVKAGN